MPKTLMKICDNVFYSSTAMVLVKSLVLVVFLSMDRLFVVGENEETATTAFFNGFFTENPSSADTTVCYSQL